MSGLDRAELNTWLSSCADVDLGFRVVTEALAIANEAAFVAAADGDELLEAHPGASVLVPALEWARGGDADAFAALVLGIVEAHPDGEVDRRRCGAMVGRDREAVHPIDVEPDRLLLLWAAAFP